MLTPDRSTFVAAARPGTRIPVCSELPLGKLAPIDLFARIRTGGPAFLLESGKSGRYSFVGAASGGLFVSRGRDCELPDGVHRNGNPFDILRALHRRTPTFPHPALPAFRGGLIGYLAYDMARQIERLPDVAADDLGLPESCFMPVDAFYQIDHAEGRLLAVCSILITDESPGMLYDNAMADLALMCGAIDRAPLSLPGVAGDVGNRVTLSQAEFESIVIRAGEYIRAGDIFQVNLSLRFDEPTGADPLELYRQLRAINPAPYMCYMDLPGQAIVSASPEQLLSVRGRTLSTRPIAGTRPRGADEAEDAVRARELIENEKERAEHLMLVDLERNDLGRVATYGSVRVEEFMAIEHYSHVIHIVSQVTAELADGRDVFDAIVACFPGGTITGAPKVRAMEIIEELEPVRRGLYTGSIGWIGYDHDAELNIAIRTVVVSRGVAHIQAGAGIVYDSVPRHEYRESVRKAEAALQALARVRERERRQSRGES